MTRDEIIQEIRDAGYPYGGFMRRLSKDRLIAYLKDLRDKEAMWDRIARGGLST